MLFFRGFLLLAFRGLGKICVLADYILRPTKASLKRSGEVVQKTEITAKRKDRNEKRLTVKLLKLNFAHVQLLIAQFE